MHSKPLFSARKILKYHNKIDDGPSQEYDRYRISFS